MLNDVGLMQEKVAFFSLGLCFSIYGLYASSSTVNVVEM